MTLRVTPEEQKFRLSLGQRMARAREQAGISRDQIAKALGLCGRGLICRWELGEVTMTSYNFVRLKKMFRDHGVRL